MTPKQKINLLHIYAQRTCHDEAYIVGNKGGLLELKRALEQALSDGKGETGGEDVPVYASDGEGYRTKVIMNNTDWLEPFWDKLSLPYLEEMASEKRVDVIWPSGI